MSKILSVVVCACDFMNDEHAQLDHCGRSFHSRPFTLTITICLPTSATPSAFITRIMPLHLLHHKSYHVYNAANIARVRADEAAAAAEEQARKDREATDRAAVRIALLRGEQPAPPPARINDELSTEPAALVQAQHSPSSTLAVAHISTTDLLFPTAAGEAQVADPSRPPPRPTPRQREAAREAAAIKREEDLHRLGGPSAPAPWYTSTKEPGQDEPEIWQEKRRRDREIRRKEWNDPLLAVKQAVREVKDVEKERERWRRQREAEVGGMTPVVESGYKRRARERSRDKRRRKYDEDEDERDSDSEKKARSRRRSRSRSPRTSKDGKSRYRSRSRDRSRRSHRKSRRPHNHDEDPELARLRKEREQREKAEREKAEALLRAEEEAKRPGWQPAQKGGRYSAQFSAS